MGKHKRKRQPVKWQRVNTLQWKCEKDGKLYEWTRVWNGEQGIEQGERWFEKYGEFWARRGIRLVRVEDHYMRKVKRKK